MGIFNALFAGVNGINSNGNAISIIGDNISNVNTVGFKSSAASFEDILAGSDTNIGLGSRIAAVSAQFSQGGFESSSTVTDVAIDGDGFFVVGSPTDDSVFYTRAGQFHVDKNGYIVNADGLRLKGFTVDAVNDTITSNVQDVVVSSTPVSPSSTSEILLKLNLSSNATVPGDFDEEDPIATSNFSAGITVYDSLGNDHLVTVYFRKDDDNAWEWYAVVDGGEITDGDPGVNEIGASGTLEFGTDGSLTSLDVDASEFNFLGATQEQEITFNFGTGTDDDGTGLDGVTQFGSNSAIINITQDGFTSGSLKSIDIDETGVITGNYTNGTNQTLAQIILASFNSREGLARVGSNNYRETLDSGSPIISAPGTGGKGTLVSSTLEQSNVDLASELIRMVVVQRGFQANTRTISAINDMLAQLVTLGQ